MSIMYAFMLSFLTVVLATGNITKSRQCVEFEIAEFRANATPIDIFMGLSQGLCMTRCVRDPSCMSFNFQSGDGRCDLLPVVASCLVPNVTKGWLFVSMATCKKRAPWQSITPENHGWSWEDVEDPYVRDDVVGMDSDNGWGYRLFIGRMYYKGLYLPGWLKIDSDMFRSVDPIENRMISCPVGKNLVLNGSVSYSWPMFNGGDVIPNNTVIGGYGPQSEPLYITKVVMTGLSIYGYYNPLNQKVHYVDDGSASESPRANILRINDN